MDADWGSNGMPIHSWGCSSRLVQVPMRLSGSDPDAPRLLTQTCHGMSAIKDNA